jgi:hypothetical protein
MSHVAAAGANTIGLASSMASSAGERGVTSVRVGAGDAEEADEVRCARRTEAAVDTSPGM